MIVPSMGLYRLPCQRTYQAIKDPCVGLRQRATEIINSQKLLREGDLNLDIVMSADYP